MKKAISFILCITLFIGIMPMSFAARDTSFEETLAEDLKQLGLFYGVSLTDFDLNRAPTRIEALVMLIRVLGSEKKALNGTWKHPFTDVPAWADKYVGYGYEHGLANGVGLTTFGTGRANAAMYLTFVLRALGYSDAYGEFTWDNPFDLAAQVGILSNGVDRANFWRADVVLVSYAALDKEVKGSGRKLADTLISAGVFTSDAFNAYYDKDAIAKKYPERVAKNSEKIYGDSKNAVFYIEVYDANEEYIGSGSGFFIDSNGTAITNHHVIEGASSAYIQLADESVYEVSGVYHYSVENDWAVIKVEGKDFSYLDIGESDTVVTGSQIYALGSPLGLQDTFSEGIISNPKRVIDGIPFIQITAPISNGSSGGALLNKYGEVIAITSAGIDKGQNLNLAIPLSLVDTTPSSYIMSFTELMNITGMMSGEDTGTSSSESGVSRQAAAFNALKTYILRNSNYTDVNGNPARKEGYSTDTSSLAYMISYDSAYNWITLESTYVKDSNFIALTTHINPVNQECYIYYAFISEYQSYLNYAGESGFMAHQLTNKVSIEMEQTEGSRYMSQSDIEIHQDMAGTMVVSLFEWLDDKLYEVTGNQYSVADFGFINLYN